MKKKLLFLFTAFSCAAFAQNNALDFDGIDDYAYSYYSGISGSGARTVEALIKTTANANPSAGGVQNTIVDWGSMANGGRFTFNVLWGNAIRLEVGGHGISASTAVNDGNWHHVAVTYDPSASSNKIKLYLDGVLDGQGDPNVAVNTTANTSTIIGMRVDNINRFDGTIDEVRIWDVVLTPTEIANNSNRELCQFNSNLKLYFKFNQGTAGGSNANITNIPDLTAGNNDGYLQNFGLSGSSSNWVAGKSSLVTAQNATSTDSIQGCGSVTLPSNGQVVSASGTFRDTLASASGCDSIITYHVTIGSPDTAVTQNGTILTAAPQQDSYQWVDCGNGYSLLTGQTSASYAVSANGSYAVIVTEGGCIDTSGCIEVTGIGLHEASEQSFILYPNPSSNGKVNIKLMPRHGAALLRVIDVTGAIHSEMNIDASVEELDLQLEGGTYIVQLVENQNIYNQSLIVL